MTVTVPVADEGAGDNDMVLLVNDDESSTVGKRLRFDFAAVLLDFDLRVVELPSSFTNRRRLLFDFEILGRVSVMASPSTTSLPCPSASCSISIVTLFKLPLLVSLMSGATVVKGGLGGASPPGSFTTPFGLVFSASLPFALSKSVGLGVYNAILRGMTSSLLPTASLLCALEKLGYGSDAFEP